VSVDGDGCTEATSTSIEVYPSPNARMQVEESGGSAAQPPLPPQMNLNDSDCVLVGTTPMPILAPDASRNIFYRDHAQCVLTNYSHNEQICSGREVDAGV
jgi:hypothetical protein